MGLTFSLFDSAFDVLFLDQAILLIDVELRLVLLDFVDEALDSSWLLLSYS